MSVGSRLSRATLIRAAIYHRRSAAKSRQNLRLTLRNDQLSDAESAKIERAIVPHPARPRHIFKSELLACLNKHGQRLRVERF